MTLFHAVASFVTALLDKPRLADEPFCSLCWRSGEVIAADVFGDYGLCGRCRRSVTSRDKAYRRA